MPSENEILQIAGRETSPEFAKDFEPITRGPLYAVLALIPLGLMAAIGLVRQKLGNR